MKSFYLIKGGAKKENQEKISNLPNKDLRDLDKFFRSLTYFPFVKNGNEFAYAILSNNEIKNIKDIFYSTELVFDFENITNDLLYKTEDKIKEFKEIFENSDKDEFSYSDFDKFMEDIYSYININLTVDVVLDKISLIGFEKLNNFDKKILEEKKAR
jgi:hypothetical protein